MYGRLRVLVQNSRADEDTILYLERKEGATFASLLIRLDLELKVVGNCFLNGRLA
ncbi:MAG: hypothetical protein ACFFD6_09610 [Candidatus Thorarchaeota archaeon]